MVQRYELDSINFKLPNNNPELTKELSQLKHKKLLRIDRSTNEIVFKGIAGHTTQQQPILQTIRELTSKYELSITRIDIALDYRFNQEYTILSKDGLNIRAKSSSPYTQHNTKYFNNMQYKTYAYNRTIKNLKNNRVLLDHTLRLEISFTQQQLQSLMIFNITDIRKITKEVDRHLNSFSATLQGKDIPIKECSDCNLNRCFIAKLNYISGVTDTLHSSTIKQDIYTTKLMKLTNLLKTSTSKLKTAAAARWVDLDARTVGKLIKYYEEIKRLCRKL